VFTVKKYIQEEEKWNKFVQESSNGTLFHSQSFLGYHQSRFSENEHHIAWYKGEALYAVMPMAIFEIDGKLVARSPYGASFGGPCIPDKFKLKHALALVEQLVDYLKSQEVQELRLTLPPGVYNSSESTYLDFALAQKGKLEAREVFNIVDLRNETEAFNLYEGRARTSLRKCADKFEYLPNCSAEQFYPILVEDKLRHEGSVPTHNLIELEWLVENMPGKIWFDIAEHKETKARAGICYFQLSYDCVMTFYMSQETKALRLDGTNFLVNKGIENALSNGTSYFDFGGSSIGYHIQNIGVAEFKESFGAKCQLRDTYTLNID
jgi:hypothetical protein